MSTGIAMGELTGVGPDDVGAVDESTARARAVTARRPLGISVLAGWHVLGGVGAVVAGLVLSAEAYAPLLIAYGCGVLVVASGLYRLRPWARGIALFGYGVNVVASLVSLNPIGLGIAVWLFAYLLNDDVRAAFEPVDA